MSAPLPESPARNPLPPLHFRFRLVHLIYATTLLASALATFGPWGAVSGFLAICFWMPVFMSAARPRTLHTACVIAAITVLPICLCLPATSDGRGAARRMRCSNNLRQISLALHTYHDTWGELPPAYIADAQGKPMHSWRVLILPYMEEQTLYDQYDFSEPWDGPNNIKLLAAMPKTYWCPSHAATAPVRGNCTSYVAVVGDGTIWPGATSAKLGDVTGDTSNAVMLIEDSTSHIPWTEPRDWTLDEALAELSSTDPKTFGPHTNGRHAAMADASVHWFYAEMSPRTWFHALTIDDRAPPADLSGTPRVVRPPTSRVLEFLRPIAFVVLLLLPLPWVWLNPTSSGVGKRHAIAASPESPSTDGPSR